MVLAHGGRHRAPSRPRLAAHPALAHAFIELHGDLGAGKTTLVRHLLRALGVQGRIKSPTYAVVEPHETAAFPVWHFDFFRFNDPREWEDAGFRDIFAGPGLKLAEWPEKAAGLLPGADLVIRIEALADESRNVTLLARTPVGQESADGDARRPIEPARSAPGAARWCCCWARSRSPAARPSSPCGCGRRPSTRASRSSPTASSAPRRSS